MIILFIIIRLFVDVSQSTFPTVLSIKVCGHKYTGSTVRAGTLSSQPLDLATVINLVELEDGKFDLLFLVLYLLWGGVVLLLAFLAASPETKNQVKGGLLLDVVVGKCTAIF